MQTIDARQVAAGLPYDQLIGALADAFRDGAVTPHRTRHTIETEGGQDGTLLLMPAWRPGRHVGVKIATVFPDNAGKNQATVQASYFLLDAVTGSPRALLDGAELTLRRTACASALAARYLARKDSRVLLMVGAGNLAPHLIAAHSTERPLERILIWARREEAAHELASTVQAGHQEVHVVTNLEAAVHQADIVSCATLASEPLIRGEWLSAGQHLDLVGAYTPNMREADGEALRRARVFVDTYAGALAESGEVIQAIEKGFLSRSDIVADLAELVQGSAAGRETEDDITLFKSVGTALEDLAAAELVLRNR
ncbi:MAG: ornithine cyclodeaminase family protein [Gammaproteobacteria bacterium]|nr:ornithine cyclodeaminase family protein [Gammaproteobacteria bacterium]